jgi:hypothetical protein
MPGRLPFWPSALPVLLSCSVLYGDPPAGQCASDADCEHLGLYGSVCDLEHGVCVLDAETDERPLTPPIRCPTSSFETRCGAAGELCSPLLTPECPCLEGDWQEPDAVVIGTISPHTLANSVGEPLSIPHVPRWLRAVNLGLEEWRREVPGARLERTNRPLALLHCNSNDELPQARRAMAHLVEVAGAPIVLTLTDNDTEAVRYQAQRQGTALICSTCFTAAPEDPAVTELVWQIMPPLLAQAPLAAFRVGELASALASEDASPAGALEVVTLSQTYPGIDEYVQEVERLVLAQGNYHVTAVQTPDPRVRNPVQLEVSRAVIDARPRLIVVGMDTDFTTYYLRGIEAEWPADMPRPHYVLTYLNQELGLLADIVRDDEGLRRRLVGTGWVSSAAVAGNLSGLERRFTAAYGERLDNTQQGYDALYAAVYALARTDQTRALEGAELSASLGLLGQGVRANVGPEALRSSLGYLLSGQPVDLVGTSNELDWHSVSHQPSSDVGLWCLTREPAGELGLLADAGIRWQSATGQISGRFVCP